MDMRFNPKKTAANRRAQGARIAAATLGATLGLAGAAPALAGPGTGALPLLSHASQLERSIDIEVTRQRYEEAYAQARRLNVAPKRNLAKTVARDPELESSLATLRKRVTKAKARARAERRAEKRRAEKRSQSAYGTPESVGVSQATLDAIAACESGGDPAAVDPSGTYRGKYQFDLGTWASMGGSGDPAAAPEAEQDYRAALLLSQSGSSPWPVCG